jgi:predicted Rossmann fold flavoprotein
MSQSHGYDVIVVGGGASGLMAAGTCSGLGLKVLVLEQMTNPGMKLLFTGGGRCNLTIARSSDEIMAAFGKQGRFMAPALARLESNGLRSLFHSCGVDTVVEENGCVFPASNSAASILDALLGRLDPQRTMFLPASRVTCILADQGRVCGVRTRNHTYPAGMVILATGGRSYPGLGGSGSGYDLAASVGHTIRPIVPALVPLVTQELWPGSLSGVVMPDVEIRVISKSAKKNKTRGGLLFTHSGLSGPAVLDISGAVAELLQKEPYVELRLNFFPGEGQQAWRRRFEQWRQLSGGRGIVKLLQDFMPRGLARQLCVLAGDDPVRSTAGHLRREQLQKILQALTGMKLTITNTEGFDRAMITRGGVSLKEVDRGTLQSKLLKGLYFAGEVLDLDGPCGGYNLQWAFSSGMLAADSCADSKNFYRR